MGRAVVGVGSPSFTLESVVSASFRAYELTGEPPLLVSATFDSARRAAETVAELIPGVEVVYVDRCRDVEKYVESSDFVVPTSASVKLALCMASAAADFGRAVLHFMFPFGPWTGLAYPLVPRWHVWGLVVRGRVDIVSVKARIDCEAAVEKVGDLLRLGRLRRELGRAACLVNTAADTPHVYHDGDERSVGEVVLELKGGALALKAGAVRVGEVKLSKAPRAESGILASVEWRGGYPRDKVREFLKKLASVLGCTSEDGLDFEQLALFLGFETYVLEPGRYLIDTNMFYGGVHNLASPEYVFYVPYCAVVELLNNAAEHKRRDEPCRWAATQLAYLAYEEVAAKWGYVVTQPYKCDVTIPLADRITTGDKTALTRDKNAAALWAKYGIETSIPETKPFDDPAYPLLQTFAAASLLAGL